MEFESNTAEKSTQISDAQRFSAASKKLELTPLHSDVAPEALENGNDTDSYGTAVATATIDSESEDTSTYQNKQSVGALPSDEVRTPSTTLVIVFAVMAVAVTVGYILFSR